MTFLPDPNGVVSTGNSGSVSSSVFTGTYEDVSQYSTTTVIIISTSSGIVITISSSVDGTENAQKYTTQTFTTNSTSSVFTYPNSSKYLKVSTSSFTGSIQTIYTQSGNSSVTLAKGTKGKYEEVTADYVGTSLTQTSYITSPIDAFGRVRVSEPFNIFSAKQQTSGVLGNGAPFDFDTITANGGTSNYRSGLPHTIMTITTTSGSRVVRQQHGYSIYQPGKSLLVFLTGTILTDMSVTNTIGRIGYYDSLDDKTVDGVKTGDGFFFEARGHATPASRVVNVVYRTTNTATYTVGSSSPTLTQTDTSVPQSSWNIDKLDGTGPSGVNIDWTKRQVFIINMEWLGVGNVIMGLFYNFKALWCHEFKFVGGQYNPAPQIGEYAYTTRASLPVRYELLNTAGTTAPVSMIHVCSSVMSEGGFTPFGPIYSAGAGFGTALSSTVEHPLLALRLYPASTAGATYYKNRPRTVLNILNISIMCSTNANIVYRIYKFYGTAPTFGTSAGTWVNSDSAGAAGARMYGSAADFNGTMTGTITFNNPYVLVFQGIFSSNVSAGSQDLTDRLRIESTIEGTSDYILLTVQHSSGGNETIGGTITWQEYE